MTGRRVVGDGDRRAPEPRVSGLVGARPRLFVTDRGEGEPVLVITGWTISSAVFEPVAHLYAPHLRTIAYDHRGSGRSAAWPAPVSMAMLAADAARVLDERGVTSAHVVGLSMGAMVGLELAVRMLARVKTLVLVGGSAGGPSTSLPTAGPAARLLTGLAGDLRGGNWPASALFSPAFRAEHPDRVAELVKPFQRFRPPPWTTGFQTLATTCFARRGDLHRVRAPTLIVHGELDAMSPLANAHALAAGIEGAELFVMEGAGHAAPLERPEEAAEKMLDWVARHARVVAPQSGRWDALAERATRPFSLHAGAARNTVELISGRGTRPGASRRRP